MQRLLGKQNDTIRYFYEGYVYHRDKRGSGTIFRCKERNKEECGAVIYVNSLDDLENQPIELQGRHLHPADYHLPLREKFTAEVLRLALTWEDPKVIFDTVKAKEEYYPIADNVSYYTDYKQKMLKARREHIPPTPSNLMEFGDMLQEYPPLRHLYQGTLRATDGSNGIIMMHEDMRQPLASCKQLYADGTFKIRALIPGFQQVYTIHFRKLDAGFPAIIVFASSQTTAMYNAVWEKVLEIIPSLRENVTTITGDFEIAQINSFKINFPNARVCGCLFHYKAAIVKKWERLRIQNCDYILEKSYALAHLPAEFIAEGAQHITTLIDREDQANLQTFGAYLRSFWVPMSDVLSVFKNPVRTNNTCENFHLHAARHVGVHQPIWKMMTKLSKVIDTAVAEYRCLSNGGRHRNWRPLDLQLTDAAIHRYETEFETNRLDVAEFLTVIANLRRLHLSRVFLFDEQQRVQTENNTINVQEQEFLMANLNAAPGAGGFIENELQIRRRRRIHEIVDRQLMPEAPHPPVPQIRRITARRIQAQPNTVARVPPGPERRPRGRPPRRAVQAPIQNGEQSVPEVPPLEIVPEPEPVPLRQIAPAPQVPARRPRGRPRRVQYAPIPNEADEPVILEVAESTAPEPPANMADDESEPQSPPRIEVVQPLRAEEPHFLVEPDAPASPAEPYAPMEVDLPVVPQVLENEPPRKKKRTRRGGTQKKCHVCDARTAVQILRPCHHRLCVPCIRNLITRNCPFCRGRIDSYLPHDMMGGERWGDGVVQDMERDWHEQLLRDLMDED